MLDSVKPERSVSDSKHTSNKYTMGMDQVS